MSVFSLQLQNNIQPVSASNKNKLKYGEVITPLDFAEKILDLLPKKVFQNPNLKWLDPCVGTGNFCVVLYKKLFQNLSAKIKEPKKLSSFFSTIRKNLTVPLSIKIRTGWDEDNINAQEVINIASSEGIEFVAIHGRTRTQAYKGHANWNYLESISSNSPLPIIGNGDLHHGKKIQERLSHTNCDALMIGRAALRNPFIFLENELKNNPTSLDAIFNSMYSSSSSLLSVSGGTSSKPVAGSYAFVMTAYVSGAFTGLVSNDTSPEVTASNNTIQVTVDGTQSGSVTVPAAHYTSEAALATAIQTAINADSTLSGAGKSVVATHANGSYSIKSGSIGSSSSMVINAIGSNLDGFLKFVGSTDADNIGTSQAGTASTALTLNGASVTATDPDGLVDNETLGSSGNFTLDGAQTTSTSPRSATDLNSFVTIGSSNNLSSVTFTITGTDINGTSQTETITGPTAGNTVVGTKIFKDITQISSNASASGVNIGTKSAFVDLTGKRPSIVSAGGDESGKTFTVVGTDLSGNAQTEVIPIGRSCCRTRFSDEWTKYLPDRISF